MAIIKLDLWRTGSGRIRIFDITLDTTRTHLKTIKEHNTTSHEPHLQIRRAVHDRTAEVASAILKDTGDLREKLLAD